MDKGLLRRRLCSGQSVPGNTSVVLSGPGINYSLCTCVKMLHRQGWLDCQVESSVYVCQELTKVDVCKFLLQKTNFLSHPESLSALNSRLEHAKEKRSGCVFYPSIRKSPTHKLEPLRQQSTSSAAVTVFVSRAAMSWGYRQRRRAI